MNTCEYYQELISRMLDDELNRQERNVLAEHLSTCDSCAAMYRAFALVSESISADLVEAPEELSEDIMARIHRAEIRRRSARRNTVRPMKNLVAAAACVAILLTAVGGIAVVNSSRRESAIYESRLGRDTATGNTGNTDMFGVSVLPQTAEESASVQQPAPTAGVTYTTPSETGSPQVVPTPNTMPVQPTAAPIPYPQATPMIVYPQATPMIPPYPADNTNLPAETHENGVTVLPPVTVAIPVPTVTPMPASEAVQEPAPAAIQEPAPEAAQESVPEVYQESVPEAIQEPAPEAAQESVPEVYQESAPAAIQEPAPEAAQEPAPAAIQEFAPETASEQEQRSRAADFFAQATVTERDLSQTDCGMLIAMLFGLSGQDRENVSVESELYDPSVGTTDTRAASEQYGSVLEFLVGEQLVAACELPDTAASHVEVLKLMLNDQPFTVQVAFCGGQMYFFSYTDSGELLCSTSSLGAHEYAAIIQALTASAVGSAVEPETSETTEVPEDPGEPENLEMQEDPAESAQMEEIIE